MSAIAEKKVAKKKQVRKKVAKKIAAINAIKNSLNQRQELFCKFFVFNDELRDNATLCYAEAFDYKLDELSKDDAVYEGIGEHRKLVEQSSYQKAYNVCGVLSHRMLKNVKVNDYLLKLRNELCTDAWLDGELVRVAMQNADLAPKIAAVKELNKLRNRITERTDITSGGEVIKSFDESQLSRIAGRLLDGRTPSAA